MKDVYQNAVLELLTGFFRGCSMAGQIKAAKEEN